LVVIAIIVILAAMLLPALQQAREAAASSNCVSQEKQIGMGIMFYSQDYPAYFPQLGPTMASHYMKDGWRTFIGHYMGSNPAKYFICPSAKKEPRYFSDYQTSQIQTVNSYGINRKFVGKPVDKVLIPSQKILLADVFSCYLSGSESFFDNSSDVLFNLSSRHSGRSNILCVDMHVMSKTKDQAKAAEYNTVE